MTNEEKRLFSALDGAGLIAIHAIINVVVQGSNYIPHGTKADTKKAVKRLRTVQNDQRESEEIRRTGGLAADFIRKNFTHITKSVERSSHSCLTERNR